MQQGEKNSFTNTTVGHVDLILTTLFKLMKRVQPEYRLIKHTEYNQSTKNKNKNK